VPDRDLAKLLELGLLRPTARARDVDALCEAAQAAHCAAVVVLPVWVPRACARLAGGDVRVCAAVAYPFGGEAVRTKAAAADQAVREGATEVEVVASLSLLADGDLDGLREELAAVVGAVRRAQGPRTVLVKATIETCYLPPSDLPPAAAAVAAAGCDYVVTSTGQGPEGATEQGVRALRDALGADVGVKAQGGIVTRADAERMLAAGAARLGTRDLGPILG
jgi:deoxyribose-phosphate aldolase